MRQLLCHCAAGAILATGVVGAHADDSLVANERIEQAFEAPISGELSVWAQGVFTTNRVDIEDDGDENRCDPTDGISDLCGNGLGIGMYAAVQMPIGDLLLIADATMDYHDTTNDDEPDSNLDALYGAVGVHLLGGEGRTRYGGFGVFGGHTALDQSPGGEQRDGGAFAGGGLQLLYDNWFVQGGAVFGLIGDDDINLDDLYFVRAGGTFDVGPGVFEASGLVGFGDFDGDDDERDDSLWLQAVAEFTAPLSGNVHGFARYQGDYLETSGSQQNYERVLLHTIAVGLTVPFGGSDVPVSTPNFRAPIVSADELS